MPKSIEKIVLQLIPLTGIETEDTWLFNNNPDLLKIEHSPAADSTPPNCHDTSLHVDYKVRELQLKYHSTSIEIFMGNEYKPLHDGGILELSGVLFRIKLSLHEPTTFISRAQDEPSSFNESLDEVWDSLAHMPINKHQQTYASYIHGQDNMPNISAKNNLDFLFKGQQEHECEPHYRNNIDSLFPDNARTSIPQLNSNVFIPEVADRQVSSRTRFNVLSNEVGNNNVENVPVQLSKVNDYQGDNPTEQLVHHGQGNVLRDLGMDESSATLINRDFTSGKPSYSEQAPIDILDEFLNDDYVAADVQQSFSVDSDRGNQYTKNFNSMKQTKGIFKKITSTIKRLT